ncbi:MAG TPA: hypothetical protein VFY18_10965 [Candidatus Limnocylindrales bacterium]|nr:hypothetical protein [Candidatus Limnocylindrales bacterium]
MTQRTDPRYTGWLGGRLIPVLTGVVASGLLLVAGLLDPGNILAFLILVGGGALIGLVLGMIVGRGAHVGPAPQPVAAGMLGAAAIVAVVGWVALGVNLASILTC